MRTGNSEGTEVQFRRFIGAFNRELSRQVELGLDATDEDYILFQKSINANVRGAAKTRHTILLRKLLQFDPKFLDVFGHSIIASSGLIQETKRLGDSIGSLIEKVNIQYAASHGVDLVKPTNKTLAAIRTFSNPIRDFAAYTDFINALYFVFWEGTGERLKGKVPPSFVDINTLRTDLQHDLDHGKPKKAASKRKKSSATFRKYANSSTPQTSAPDNFPLLQVGLLNQIQGDLRTLVLTLV